jgi:Mrp family chromosome partitioning ATPase
MTILEALEKAKRTRQERSRIASDGSMAADAAVKPRTATEIEPVPMVRLSIPQIDYDPRRCEENRVLGAPAKDQAYSVVADAYRILRTRLWQKIESAGWNSLAITSAGPAEGKSVTALNLALTMALERKRNIFLLDLDLRNPSLCRYIGARPKVGIGSFLAGEAKVEEIFFSIGMRNLVFAGGLTSYEHSSELLGGTRLKELITYIQNVDPRALILADLPPLLSTADALVVAPQLSATLLVVAEGVTQRDGFNRAVEVLSAVKVAGIVLNYARESVGKYYG